MTNEEKRTLKNLVKEGRSFTQIRKLVYCSDATIKKYIKILTT